MLTADLYPMVLKTDSNSQESEKELNVEGYWYYYHLLKAINSFLNPDAIIASEIEDIEKYTIEQFRKAFMNTFYGIGPAELWYGDAFIG